MHSCRIHADTLIHKGVPSDPCLCLVAFRICREFHHLLFLCPDVTQCGAQTAVSSPDLLKGVHSCPLYFSARVLSFGGGRGVYIGGWVLRSLALSLRVWPSRLLCSLVFWLCFLVWSCCEPSRTTSGLRCSGCLPS